MRIKQKEPEGFASSGSFCFLNLHPPRDKKKPSIMCDSIISHPLEPLPAMDGK
jgi:hypothetical protein